MAASDYVPTFLKNRLHLAGRPQMSTRPQLHALADKPCNARLRSERIITMQQLSAYEDALRALHISDRDDPINEIIAQPTPSRCL